MYNQFVSPPQLKYHTLSKYLRHKSHSTLQQAIESSNFLVIEETSGHWKNGEYLNILKNYKLLDQHGCELYKLDIGNWTLSDVHTYRDCTRFPSDYYYNYKLVGGKIKDQFGNILEEKEYPTIKEEEMQISYDGINGITLHLKILKRLQEFSSVEEYLRKGGRGYYYQLKK